jgi:hypothetical protein
VNGKASAIRHKDLIRLGEEHDVRNPAGVIEQVVDSVSKWNQHAAAKDITPGNSAVVAEQHRLRL